MKTHRRFLFALFIWCHTLPTVWGQVDLQREFDAYVRRENDRFDQTIRQMNKEFALYLRQEWQPFDLFIRQTLLKDPDQPISKPQENRPPPLRAKPEESITYIPPAPFHEKLDSVRTSARKVCSFYERTVSFPFRPAYCVGLGGTHETAVATAWDRASDVDYTPLLEALQRYKTELRLNDWAFMLLVRRAVETCYGEEKGDRIVFLTAYLLNQSGESVRLGRMAGRLVLLLEIKEVVYALPQLTSDGRTFTLFSDEPLPASLQLYTYRKSFPRATRSLSLHIPAFPAIGKTILTHNLPNRWRDTTISVAVNKVWIDFLATLPQTDFRVYLESATSPQMEKLIQKLRSYTEGLGEKEAVSLLLDFVQNAFAYQSDTRQFGQEKVFFPDEMLYYPYNDCEDRAIFFCRLVSRLLRLKVALVSYPNHIAAAVCFPTPVEAATSYRSGQETYTLCDPTYIHAGVGECMPQFAGKQAKLIKQSYY